MSVKIICADVLEGLRQLPDESVHCAITSPPYWGLRDYGVPGQLGLEKTPADYLNKIVNVFRELRRVLREDGTLWVNVGDAYANDGKWGGETSGMQSYLDDASRKRNGREKRITGLKPKDLIGMPWRLAFALQDDGWYLRSDIIWAKPNPMPESVRDRVTKAHEYIFMFAKAERYFFDAEAIKEERVSDEDAYGFRGGSYVHDEPGPRTAVGNRKIPSGWNTGPGSHGTFRTDGRVKLRKSDNTSMSHVPGARPHSGIHRAGQPREFLIRNKRSVWTIPTVPFNGSGLLADYVGADGKAYRLSEDCPTHGRNDRPQTQQMDGCGERRDRRESRTSGTDVCRGAEHEGGLFATLSMTTDTNRSESVPAHEPRNKPARKRHGQSQKHSADDLGVVAGSQTRNGGTQECTTPLVDETGSRPRDYSQIAKPHNKRNHKTGRDPATNFACNASSQTDGRIVGTSASREPFDLAGHTPESNSEPGGLDDLPSGQREFDSGRRSSCAPSKTKCTCLQVSTDHFATFPTALVEPMVLAGCPEGGTVLDPFCGAGTTCLVADRLQRNAIGIELNPAYVAMAEKRIRKDAPLFAEVSAA